MIIHVYSAEITWGAALLVTCEQLKVFLSYEKHKFLSPYPGNRLLLQDGYFEVKEDYSLVKIDPTEEEIQGDGKARALWINLGK